MIKGESIICFAGEDWWYHNAHSNMHIMKALAKHENRVLFVNSIGLRMPDLKKHGIFAFKKIVNKARSMLRYLVRAESNIYVFTPIAIPYLKGWERLIHPVNAAFVALQVRVVCWFLRFQTPIIWACLPSVKDIVLRLVSSRKHKCLVYYSVDNQTYHAGEMDANVYALETELHGNADIALFVNRQLVAERSKNNPRTFHLEHGVDYDHFAIAQGSAQSVPSDIASIPRPIVGYVGVLRSLDYDLIRYLCESNREFSFVFIGEVEEHMPVQDLTNLHFLGKKSYEELPRYMQAMDCLTILYKKDDVFNNYRNPKKLLEYFATGKPVVSIPILELRHFGELIALADAFEDFNLKMRQAVSNDPPTLRQRRIAYAQSHTWDDVAEKASEYIETFLGGKRYRSSA